MPKLTVFIDLDGVVVNFLDRYAQYYLKDKGIYVDYAKISSYHLPDTMPTTRKYEYLYDQDFYNLDKGMKLMPHAVESVHSLFKDYDVKFATACVTKESAIGKVDMLSKLFSWFNIEKHFIALSRKQYLSLPNSLIIDDSPYLFKETQFPVNVCFAHPYNTHNKELVDLYTNHWPEIVGFIGSLSSTPTQAILQSLR